MQPGEECHHCPGTMRERPYTFTICVGQYVIDDKSGTILTCDECDEGSISDWELEEYELRAAAKVLNEHPFALGAVVTFARKALSMSVPRFAEMLGVSVDTAKAWEDERAEMHPESRATLVARLDAKLREPRA